MLRNFISISFPVGKYPFKHNGMIIDGQTYPLNFIRNISQWHHILGVIGNNLYIFFVETIIAAIPNIVNNCGFDCSVPHSSP